VKLLKKSTIDQV